MVTFRHEWESPLNRQETFDLLKHAFENSALSPVWPTSMARVTADRTPLRTGTPVTVVYQAGPLRMNARYTVARAEDPSYLRYETQDSHPLRGGAEISLSPTPTGTHCRWEGRYSAKRIWSTPALLWFKLYFERRFFSQLVSSFAALPQPELKRRAE